METFLMVENAAMAELEQRRILKTAIPGPRSLELMARKTGAVARGIGTTMPVFAAEAGGGVVVDVDGNSLIDFGSGIAVTTIGNSAPRVVAAVRDQVELFTHTCFMITPYEGYVAVAEQLNQLTPGDYEKRSVLFNSGAEAVENSVKIARAYTKKQAVVAFDHAYHGRTNLAMALTAKSMPYKHSFGPFAPEVYRAPMSYPYRDDKLMDGELAAHRATDLIDKQVGTDNLAAVIIEPIQGEGGFIVPADGFLAALADWCRSNDVVFIADEIQTGFARTGAMFACELFDVVPDLIATAKGIAGGGHWAGRDHGSSSCRWSRRNVRRQPGRLCRSGRRDRDDQGREPRYPRSADRADHDEPAAPDAGRGQSHRRCPWSRRNDRR
jgi:4-aminobutyrate aminotransferase/(S)-3-amino-2-methylpropionate transaminase